MSAYVDELENQFCGWYYHGLSGGVRHAVTAGAYSERLTKLIAADDSIVRVGTNFNPVAHMYSIISDGRFNSAQGMELNKRRGVVSERVIPLLIPFTVRVVGPTPVSRPVECIVAGVAVITAMYQIIENKVVSRLHRLLQEHFEEEELLKKNGDQLYKKDTAGHRKHTFVSLVKSSEMTTLSTLAKFLEVYENALNDPLATDDKANATRLAIALGSVMLMASIQHNADIDAGDRFRDKRGRQASLDEYEAALKNVLFH